MTACKKARALATGLMLLAATTGGSAQGTAPDTQMVSIDGREMGVAVNGLEQRTSGQPVVILEAGAGETGIETWTPVFDELARIAPVCGVSPMWTT